MLSRYGRLDAIPPAPGQWDVPGLRGAAKLAVTLQGQLGDALLYRRLATLDEDGPEVGTVDDWRWRGPGDDAPARAAQLGADGHLVRARRLAKQAAQRR